jgi:hypothetical protein
MEEAEDAEEEELGQMDRDGGVLHRLGGGGQVGAGDDDYLGELRHGMGDLAIRLLIRQSSNEPSVPGGVSARDVVTLLCHICSLSHLC